MIKVKFKYYDKKMPELNGRSFGAAGIEKQCAASCCYQYQKLGAVNDGKADNAKSIQQVIDACNKAGDGR